MAKRGGFLDPIENDPREQCLICGLNIETNSNVVKCLYHSDDKIPCNFKCHSRCVKAHNKIGENKIFTNRFKCNNVEYQFRPNVVETILSQNHNPGKKISYLRNKNKVKSPKNPRKRRYSESVTKCYLCHKQIPLAQKNHLLQHCSAIKAPPANLGEIRDYRKFSTRCFEIATKRLKLHDSNVEPDDESTSPTRQLPPAWGETDGESISEANTRRKRRREQ